MDFLSHLRPNKIKMTPTTRRKIPIGTYCTSATPRVATINASVAAAARAPASELRQLIVTPTTSTIVNASTNSTAEARNEAKTTAHCEPRIAAHCMRYFSCNVKQQFDTYCITWIGCSLSSLGSDDL